MIEFALNEVLGQWDLLKHSLMAGGRVTLQ